MTAPLPDMTKGPALQAAGGVQTAAQDSAQHHVPAQGDTLSALLPDRDLVGSDLADATPQDSDVLTVDAIGLLCPLPVLRARKVLQGLPKGRVVKVLTTDGMALIDLPHFCTTTGHAYLCAQEEDGHHAHLIRRG